MKMLRPIALFLALLLAIPVFAADGERQVVGDVQAKDADSITVVLDSKKAETFAITRETKFLRGRDTVAASDIVIGDVVMIHTSKTGGQEVASTVAAKPRS